MIYALVDQFGISMFRSVYNTSLKLVRMSPWDAEWLLKELIENNPAIWMLDVNSFIVDVRDLPLEVQQEAARRGLIPLCPIRGRNKNSPSDIQNKSVILIQIP